MGWWWPFSSNGESKDRAVKDVQLDSDLKEYYDTVIQQDHQRQQQRETQLSIHEAPESGPDSTDPAVLNAARIRPVSAGRSNDKNLKQIALDNCVEFEKAYSSCLLKGTYFDRFGGCQTQLTMYEQCQNMQMEALQVLEFLKAQSDAEKRAIKMQADDLMIKTVPTLRITEGQSQAFSEALEAFRKQDQE